MWDAVLQCDALSEVLQQTWCSLVLEKLSRRFQQVWCLGVTTEFDISTFSTRR